MNIEKHFLWQTAESGWLKQCLNLGHYCTNEMDDREKYTYNSVNAQIDVICKGQLLS